jgi:hypothetical protein
LQSPSSSILCDELSPTDMNPNLILAHAPGAVGTDLRGSEQNRTVHPIPSEPKGGDVPCLPRPFDVLLGRGKSNLNHPGNKYFQGTAIVLRFRWLGIHLQRTIRTRSSLVKPIAYSLTTCIFCGFTLNLAELIHMNRDRYFNELTTMEEKRVIVMNIVEFMQRTGRYFLKEKQREGKCSVWVRLSEEATRHKVAHALQYRQRRTVSQNQRPLQRQRNSDGDWSNDDSSGPPSKKIKLAKPQRPLIAIPPQQTNPSLTTIAVPGVHKEALENRKMDGLSVSPTAASAFVSPRASSSAPATGEHGELLELLLCLRQSEPKPPSARETVATVGLPLGTKT